MPLMTVPDGMLISLLLREREGKGSGILSQLDAPDLARAARIFEAMKDSKSPISRMIENAREINNGHTATGKPHDDNDKRLLAGDKGAQMVACSLRRIQRGEDIAALRATKCLNLDSLVSPAELKEALRIAQNSSEVVGPVWADAVMRLGAPLAAKVLDEARTLLGVNAKISELELEQTNDLDPDEIERAAFAQREADAAALVAANARRDAAYQELKALEAKSAEDKARAARIDTLKKELGVTPPPLEFREGQLRANGEAV